VRGPITGEALFEAWTAGAAEVLWRLEFREELLHVFLYLFALTWKVESNADTSQIDYIVVDVLYG
jgi:hypothetical protein